MLKNLTLFVMTLAIILTAACASDKDSGAVNPTTGGAPATAAAPMANINYATGFFDEEKGPAGAWRWVGEEGVVKLKNTKGDMTLKIAGSAPIDLIKDPSEVTIKLNGEQLEKATLTLEKNTFEKEFTIPASKQGSGEFSELTISSSKSFVPKVVYKNSSDDRKLSFSLTKLEWTAK